MFHSSSHAEESDSSSSDESDIECKLDSSDDSDGEQMTAHRIGASQVCLLSHLTARNDKMLK